MHQGQDLALMHFFSHTMNQVQAEKESAMGISPTQLVIVLVIVALIFGTKKLRNIGGDIGGAIKGFKQSTNDESSKVTTEKNI